MKEILLDNTLNKAQALLKEAKYARNDDCYRNRLSSRFHGYMLDYTYQLQDIGADIFQKKSVNLQEEQYMHKLLSKMNSLIAKFYITLLSKDTDKNILKIKENLKNNYGVKHLYCDNNVAFAKKCIKVAKLLNKYGIKMPKTIIGSNCYQCNSGMQFNLDKYGTTILLDANSERLFGGITKSPLELIVHEIMHCLQKDLLILNQKKLPEKYNKLQKVHPDILLDIDYRCNQEAHANLLTKKVLSRLSKDEEKLLEYLNSLFV